jgi:hypothetical protein
MGSTLAGAESALRNGYAAMLVVTVMQPADFWNGDNATGRSDQTELSTL